LATAPASATDRPRRRGSPRRPSPSDAWSLWILEIRPKGASPRDHKASGRSRPLRRGFQPCATAVSRSSPWRAAGGVFFDDRFALAALAPARRTGPDRGRPRRRRDTCNGPFETVTRFWRRIPTRRSGRGRERAIPLRRFKICPVTVRGCPAPPHEPEGGIWSFSHSAAICPGELFFRWLTATKKRHFPLLDKRCRKVSVAQRIRVAGRLERRGQQDLAVPKSMGSA
jgi:hypothetical protein